MYDENGFVREEQAEVFTECKVVEPQDHKKKRGQKKKFAKAAAVVLCAALLAGGGFAVGNYTAKPRTAIRICRQRKMKTILRRRKCRRWEIFFL